LPSFRNSRVEVKITSSGRKLIFLALYCQKKPDRKFEREKIGGEWRKNTFHHFFIYFFAADLVATLSGF
jgi:hypothetical protein